VAVNSTATLSGAVALCTTTSSGVSGGTLEVNGSLAATTLGIGNAILLDAPCSASGIVRRHPDIRWLRRPDDIAALARVQAELLDALWPLLATGGRLLYATCSIFHAEGQDQIDAFLQRVGPGAARLDPASPGHLLSLPDNGSAGAGPSADGFFYALLHKKS
jgi:16S rRNA (cytosine967-C5)-methyltransferase